MTVLVGLAMLTVYSLDVSGNASGTLAPPSSLNICGVVLPELPMNAGAIGTPAEEEEEPVRNKKDGTRFGRGPPT